jgi:SulP family sulfate permease
LRNLFIKEEWLGNVRGDILSGITVALALIPEAISFAIICGVDPMVGLYASFCIAITISIFGGRPGMISAATGSMALVIVTLVRNYGIEYMLAATILTGIIQFVLGKLKFGKLISFVPQSVILGFVNSLAILIFMAQIPHFIGESWVMYALVIGTLIIVYGLPRFTKIIPGPLVAIVFVTIVSIIFKVNVRTVGDMGSITRALPVFHLVNVPLTFETLRIIFPYAVTLSLVGLLESLLTATIVDDLTETKGNMNREVTGQGIANIVAGCFGGMAGCAMIGQSVINIKSGGRKRLSALVSGVFLLFLIIVLGDIVAMIPMAALVGVMIMVSISTFEWHSIRQMKKLSLSSNIEMLATMAIVLVTDNLAYGVIAGIAISAINFAWKIADVNVKEHLLVHDNQEYKIYRITGQLFFASTLKFSEMFNFADDPDNIIVDFKNSHVWDHSAVEALSKVKERYNKLNKEIHIVGLNKESSDIVLKLYEDMAV